MHLTIQPTVSALIVIKNTLKFSLWSSKCVFDVFNENINIFALNRFFKKHQN